MEGVLAREHIELSIEYRVEADVAILFGTDRNMLVLLRALLVPKHLRVLRVLLYLLCQFLYLAVILI